MTLCLSVLSEEGVVLAADSLGTLLSIDQRTLRTKCECGAEETPNMQCPKCGKIFGPAPSVEMQSPATQTFHYQKLFRLNKWVGLAIAGAPKFRGSKIQHWVSNFINWLNINHAQENETKQICNHFKNFLIREKAIEGFKEKSEIMIAGISQEPNRAPVGMSLVLTKGGITDGGTTGYGIRVAGVHDILDKMFGQGGIREYPVREFPLQDAVEFAHFLMQTQIGVDRYTNRIPRVGGEIDIAVIHPVHGFKWVMQKELQRILES